MHTGATKAVMRVPPVQSKKNWSKTDPEASKTIFLHGKVVLGQELHFDGRVQFGVQNPVQKNPSDFEFSIRYPSGFMNGNPENNPVFRWNPVLD